MGAEITNLLTAQKPTTTKFSPGNPVPLAVKLAVRSFYVLQGLKPSQIGPMVGLSAKQVYNLSRREGWSTERVANRSKISEKVKERQDARAADEIAFTHKAIAIRSEELSVKSLDHCAEILGRTMEDGITPAIDSKSLQMATGAARNLVQIARMSRGLDARRSESAGNDGAPSVNVFLVRGETLERPMLRAEVVVEAEVKTISNA